MQLEQRYFKISLMFNLPLLIEKKVVQAKLAQYWLNPEIASNLSNYQHDHKYEPSIVKLNAPFLR